MLGVLSTVEKLAGVFAPVVGGYAPESREAWSWTTLLTPIL